MILAVVSPFAGAMGTTPCPKHSMLSAASAKKCCGGCGVAPFAVLQCLAPYSFLGVFVA